MIMAHVFRALDWYIDVNAMCSLNMFSHFQQKGRSRIISVASKEPGLLSET